MSSKCAWLSTKPALTAHLWFISFQAHDHRMTACTLVRTYGGIWKDLAVQPLDNVRNIGVVPPDCSQAEPSDQGNCLPMLPCSLLLVCYVLNLQRRSWLGVKCEVTCTRVRGLTKRDRCGVFPILSDDVIAPDRRL